MMPAAAGIVRPRWPAVPYLAVNGTSGASPQPTPTPDKPNAINKPPAVIPSPIYTSVSIVPASNLPPPPSHAAVNIAPDAATFLAGYCTDPAYTIIDGPTAVWMPVIGCISSKRDCCPTPVPKDGNAKDKPAPQFPISLLPSQGVLTGCPDDYHTVDGTACCPSSYWLWSTTLGGQVPCYSSLGQALSPPPIPDTLVDSNGTPRTGGSRPGSTPASTTASTDLPSGTVPALTMTQKPTLAIINIAFAMQYPMEPPKPALQPKAKIGIGVGASGAAILLALLAWFLVRRFSAHRSTTRQLQERNDADVRQRFGSGIDTSRGVYQDSSRGRVFGGKKYAGVSSAAVNY